MSTIVNHAHKSTVATDVLEGERRLQTACVTRWNSDVRSVRSVLNCPEDKLAQLNTTQLTKLDRSILTDMLDVLEPFEEATNVTQGDKIVTSSFIIPCIVALKRNLTTYNGKHNGKLVSALLASVKKRLTKYEQIEDYKMASVLDPRFRLTWCTAEQATDITVALKAKLPAPNPVHTPRADPCQQPPPKRSRLFDIDDVPATPTNSLASTEVADYLQQPKLSMAQDPLDFWKLNETKFPRLSALATKYLCIPATSAPVERLFSVAGRMFRADRCRLTDARFETLMFLKCNK